MTQLNVEKEEKRISTKYDLEPTKESNVLKTIKAYGNTLSPPSKVKSSSNDVEKQAF